MDENSNKNCYEIFLHKWGEQFSELKHILGYLISYQNILHGIEISDIIDSNSIESSHNEWIWLCSKFHHPLEKEFFKSYWIPIVKDSLDYFIDISNDSLPIFETKYFWLEPYGWYKNYITHDVRELLLALDKGIDIDELKNRIEKQHWNAIQEMLKKRRNL